jgi:beta-galactosidase GanA
MVASGLANSHHRMEMRVMKTAFRFAGVLAVVATVWAQTNPRPLPRLVHKDGRYALFVDDAPYLMLGAQVRNSSAWPGTLPKVWPAIEYLHANTVEMPVYWEQFEPLPGKFDYSVMDTLLAQARQHRVHLVLLWFGLYKNGSQHYTPEWMKLDPASYQHITGKDGRPVDSPSPFAKASLDADIHAFTAFMRHLKEVDAERTVLLVQVENEAGTWQVQRDYSAAAQKLFDAPVPAVVLSAMRVPGGPSEPNWHAAFGAEAEVNFHAWAVATYVGKVAAAGKAVYPLPLYANAALRDPIKPGAPGTYESGGPTDNVLPIWKVAAPALDILAPDIYLEGSAEYLKVLDLYHRGDNALFIPETGRSAGFARYLFSALGQGAIGFSPFGMDYVEGGTEEQFAPIAQEYRLLAPLSRQIARLNFEGKLKAVAEVTGEVSQTLDFGAWKADVSYGEVRNGLALGNPSPSGRALVAQLGENQFLVTGISSRVDFRPNAADKQRQFLRVEEVTYANGVFKMIRIWNGDETDWGINFRSAPVLLRVSLATY